MIEKTTIGGALATYLEASKQKSELVKPLETWLLRQPRGTDRSTKKLHPSEVAHDKWCPRYAQEVLEGRIKVKPETHRFQMLNIFAEGHAIHAKWQTWLGQMGVLYGYWSCMACSSGSWSYGIPDGFEMCEHPQQCYVYMEVPMSTPMWESHADGIVLLPAGYDRLLEIKSIGTGTIRMGDSSLLSGGADLSTAFKRITVPFAPHRRQVQIYMYLVNRLHDVNGNYPSVDSAIILYECKSDQNVKEFVVPYDPGSISFILNQAEKIESLLHSGTLVECPYDEGECEHSHE